MTTLSRLRRAGASSAVRAPNPIMILLLQRMAAMRTGTAEIRGLTRRQLWAVTVDAYPPVGRTSQFTLTMDRVIRELAKLIFDSCSPELHKHLCVDVQQSVLSTSKSNDLIREAGNRLENPIQRNFQCGFVKDGAGQHISGTILDLTARQ